MLAVLDPVQSNDLRRGGVIEEGQIMDAYLQGSALRWAKARARVPDKGQFLLYGAGSHSARLLPTLSPDQRSRLVAVFDGNRNLHGKTLGPWLVQHPRELANYPSLPVLVSSYRAERAIVNELLTKFQNSLIQMYQ